MGSSVSWSTWGSKVKRLKWMARAPLARMAAPTRAPGSRAWRGLARPRGPSTPTARIRLYDPYATAARGQDRKSTRLNSSHVKISYAVFCLKKKKRKKTAYIKNKKLEQTYV